MGKLPGRVALLRAAWFAFSLMGLFSCGASTRDDRPNIVLVLVDDQDYMLNSTHPRYMPELDRLVRQRGLEVQHFITSYASCCPSRTSLLTGRHCHNTNMTSNAWPYGGYIKFKLDQLDDQYLPVWLQAAGYDTYYVGKFLNGFTTDSAAALGCPGGWTDLDGLAQGDTGGGEELYYRDTPVFLRNCRLTGAPAAAAEAGARAGEPAGAAAGVGAGAGAGKQQPQPGGSAELLDAERWPDTFLEPVVRQKALSYIDAAAAKGKPFYLQVNTFAPHDSEGGSDALPEVEVKYRGLYADVKLPKSANFAVQVPKQIGYYWPTDVKEALPSITARYRARLQALRSVDDTVSALVSRLACRGLLNRTVFIYTSDNGFKLGNHDITQEKFTQYEEDVRLPLLMTGPGIPVGAATGSEFQAAMTDITATVLWLAGATTGSTTIDGSALPLPDLMARYSATTALDGAAGDVNTQFCTPAPPPDPPNPPAPPRPPPMASPPPKQPNSLFSLFPRPPPGGGSGEDGGGVPKPATAPPSPAPSRQRPPPSPPLSPRPPTTQPLPRPSPHQAQPEPVARPPPIPPSPTPSPTPAVTLPPASHPTAAPLPPSPAPVRPLPPSPEPSRSSPSPMPPSPTAQLLPPQPLPPQPWPPQPQPRPTADPSPGRQPHAAAPTPRKTKNPPRALPPPSVRAGQRRQTTAAAVHGNQQQQRQQVVPAAAATSVPATDSVPLIHMLGGWRPAGWSWQHDLWIQEHAEGLGLHSWVEEVRAAAATTSAALNGSSGPMSTAAAGQDALLAALAARPLKQLVDGPRLAWYSEERVRVALREAAEQVVARQAALRAMSGTEGTDTAGAVAAHNQRHVLLDAAAGTAGSAGGPVPASRLESWSNVALIEAWLDGVFKGKYYKAIRACTTHQAFGGRTPWTCYKYTVLCNSVKKQTPYLTNIELYDLGQDPAEVKDRSKLPWAPATRRLIDRLDALLTVLAYCRGNTCRDPFSRMHPDGAVTNLAAAMDPKYDSLYGAFQKLQYTQCGIYYDPKNERPDPFLAGRTEQ
ncbi:hypothetical protein CHLRE_02g085850v5 [Chlamydomonas reinhardtii]|uniref:Sulfatase N-terminal domain-containing protein n=1 Tax=Chlamydomonas reinhardtii TaxID=3055 RepID=A0A2K3E0V8_CHLRE|nr:uncharacterized protein CHLRE_02g085850v5 [Chlamydomonas reinhardtii]PNW86422.1 hypothetical protein CHLRE_02g085850v5 [Chlamydomonas reinhardtii]